MGPQPTTIVPAHRLGQLLAEARLSRGRDLEELSRSSSGVFTVGELSDLEAGHRLLDDGLIAAVTSLYEIDCGPIIPQRAELTIDLDRNLLYASGRSMRLDSGERDHIIDRYLALVYVLRNRPPGTSVPLRQEDVAILAASLAERAELVEEQLLLVMDRDGEPVRGLIRWFKNRLWVPGAGALVGAVSVGTLVMVTSDSPILRAETSLPLPPEGDEPPRRGTVAGGRSASGTGSVTTEVDPELQRIGAEAEALLPFEWRTSLPEWTVAYRPAHDDFRGLTFPYDRTIELYVRESDTPRSLAGILAHELGHALDVSHFSDADRDRWTDVRGIDDSPWWPTAYAGDFETGAGDFAESFAYWAVGDASSSRLGGPPNDAELAVLVDLVDPYL